MLEGEAGTIQVEPAVAEKAVPVVDGPKEGEVAAESTATPKFPGWTGQLSKDQLADIQARVAKDPKAIDTLPKGLSELYAAYASLSESSKNALKRPAQDAPKEAWDQFYKELGRPESPEGYTLQKPEIPSGMRYDDSAEKWFRGIAHGLGLTQSQAQGIFDNWNTAQMEAHKQVLLARKAQSDAAIGELKAKWKDEFPDKWEGMRQTVLQFVPGGKEGRLNKKIEALGLDNDPEFLQMFVNIYEKIGPSKIVVPSGEGSGSEDKGGFRFGANLKARD
jgi:hypothetical protein